MEFLRDEIIGFMQSIWSATLGCEVQLGAEQGEGARGAHSLTGCVLISGAFSGAVLLHCGMDHARRTAGLMFSIGPEEVGREEIEDAVGELANMIGGNLKALLPEPSHLSLPTVTEGKDYRLRLPGSREVAHVDFEWEGSPLSVAVLRIDE